MDEAPRIGLVRRFIAAAEYLNRQYYLGTVDAMDGVDMTVPQIKTLMALERSGLLSMSALSYVLGQTLGGTGSLVDRMVRKGLIARRSDRNDRRLVLCEITPAGSQAIAQLWEIGQERLQRVADVMTDEQLEASVVGLEHIKDAEQHIQKTITEINSGPLSESV